MLLETDRDPSVDPRLLETTSLFDMGSPEFTADSEWYYFADFTCNNIGFMYEIAMQFIGKTCVFFADWCHNL